MGQLSSDKIYIMAFDAEKRSSQMLSLEDLHAQTAASAATAAEFYWVDIESEELDFLRGFLSSFSIDCSWENYFDKPEILPHLKDNFSSVSFYLYDVINAGSHFDSAKNIKEIEHAPYLLILVRNFVITYHKRHLDVIEYIKKDCQANFLLAGRTPVFVAFLFIHQSMYNYARINLANDNFLDSIEANVLANKDDQSMPDISVAGYNILVLKKMNANLHIILFMLVTKRSYVVPPAAQESLKHMLDATVGIREAIDSSRDLLDSIIGSIQAQSSRKTSKVVHLLTMVSTIFMPLTLISGIFGMNFENMPELHWYYGYFYALGLMVAVASGFLYFFKRKGWIWSGSQDSDF